MSTERGIAYGGRPLWQRSPRSSPSRGKPGTWRRRAGGFDGIRQGGLHNARHRNCTERHQQKSRLNHWRAGCGESRMSGSEGGRRKSAPITRSNSPAAYPTPGRPQGEAAGRAQGALHLLGHADPPHRHRRLGPQQEADERDVAAGPQRAPPGDGARRRRHRHHGGGRLRGLQYPHPHPLGGRAGFLFPGVRL